MDNCLVEKISRNISKKHTKFLGSVGEIPYKVSADYALLLTDTTTKINLIIGLLRRSNVVDGHRLESFGEYNKLILSKSGLDFKVEILTNGTSIFVRSANEMVDHETLHMSRVRYYPKKDGWDWEEFANGLVEFIHVYMYGQQKSEEINFDSAMRGEGLNL